MIRSIALAVAALCLTVALTPPADADQYILQSNGLYLHGNTGLYYRYYNPGYYGSYYYPNGYYIQVPYTPPAAPSPPPANWRELAIKQIGQIQEDKAFKETRDVLAKLAGAPGAAPAYGQYSNLNLSAFQTSGTTGYAYQAGVQDLGKAPDLDRFVQAVAQNIANLNTTLDNANKDFSDTLSQEAARQAQARTDQAQQQARNAAIIAAIQALANPPKTTAIQATLQNGPAPIQGATPPPAVLPGDPFTGASPALVDTLWRESSKKCAACHSGQKVEGSFDLAKIDTYSDDYKAKVLARIHQHAPEAKRMPRVLNKDGSSGSAAPALPGVEYTLWLKRLSLKKS